MEGAVEGLFHGLIRKNGDPMSWHSLDVGLLAAAHPMAT